MRACKQCGTEKSEADFYSNPQQPCKECHKGNARANRLARLEDARAYDRRRANAPRRVSARKVYAQSPRGRERMQAAKNGYAERNDAKNRARFALSNAVRDGRIKKESCVVCATTENVQGHHFDYSRPLDVVWLCVHHHTAFHKVEREIQRMEAKAA